MPNKVVMAFLFATVRKAQMVSQITMMNNIPHREDEMGPFDGERQSMVVAVRKEGVYRQVNVTQMSSHEGRQYTIYRAGSP